jgi:hypothetical protein
MISMPSLDISRVQDKLIKISKNSFSKTARSEHKSSIDVEQLMKILDGLPQQFSGRRNKGMVLSQL